MSTIHRPLSIGNKSYTALTTIASADTAQWLAFSWVATANRTLSKIRVHVSAVGGTQANRAMTCEIYSDSGSPNAALSAAASVTNFTTGVNEFTISQALTAGVRYWAVIKNTAAAPATETISLTCANIINDIQVGSSLTWGWCRSRSTNSGSTWATASGNVGMEIEHSDGFIDGGMVVSVFTTANILAGGYGTVESGTKFTTPANAGLNIDIASAYLRRTGTAPAAGCCMKIRFGSNTYTSLTVPAYTFSTVVAFLTFVFTDTISIPAGTVVRVTICDVGGTGNTSNYYSFGYAEIPDNAVSKGLINFGCQLTHTDDNTAAPIVWAETDTYVPNITLGLLSTGEFTASGGGGGGGIMGIM